MIYARLDVDILDHPKVIGVTSAARDLWVWGILYSRKHETDGALTMAAVLASPWGAGGRANIRLAAKLVEAGLWERTPIGFLVLRYAAKNETRAAIDERRKEARERVEKHRMKRVTNALVTTPVTSACNALVPGSDSDSVLSDLPEGESARGGTAKPSTIRYREAYAAGVAKRKGSPWAWPPGPTSDGWADKDLGYAIATFAKSRSTGKGLRGDDLLGWIEAAAEDFVAHVIGTKDDPKFWSNFAPKGLVRFLNQDTMSEEARRVG